MPELQPSIVQVLAVDLLTLDEFRSAVFARDGRKCVLCKQPAVDAHHIVERRLWPDGGYYLANGASLCEEHHLAAESTVLSCDEIRNAAGIEEIVLPPHFYSEEVIDKWGNPVCPNGQRLRGEFFHDESVQKAIRPVLHLFTDRVKYPRTFHLPWSRDVASDDRVMESLSGFENEEVVVTIKMDGEQTTMYRDGFHARSLETPPHPSRDWLWGVHRYISHEIPQAWRICGENLYAKHSIHYLNLSSYFLIFGIWNEKNICLSWDETAEWAELLGQKTVPVLWRGRWTRSGIESVGVETYDGDPCEGYVVRVARAFSFKEFKDVVGKNIRKDHVHTHGHWMREAIVQNRLKGG